MPLIDYAELRSQVPMERVLSLLHFVPTKRRGDQLRGKCPVHSMEDGQGREDRRCFSVNISRGVFRCFRCGVSGNQLDLWRLVRRQSLYEAALELSHQAGIEPPWLDSPLWERGGAIPSPPSPLSRKATD